MKRFGFLLAISFAFLCGSAVYGQKNIAKPSPNFPMLGVEDLRPGMKGVARTVFVGTETQDFGVEILGVLPGYPAPHQSAIIARLSGNNVEKTGVFAGMSGSPVFIDGRLVGAIAFSFPF